MNDLSIYWIWLQKALGYGSHKVKRIFDFVDDVCEFYESGLSFWGSLSIFTERELVCLSNSLDYAKDLYEKCTQLGYHIVYYGSKYYPPLLCQIHNPPCVLYTKGKIPFLSSDCISIVGSRQGSVYGIEMAKSLAEDLSANGLTIVSGGALGIDSAAHIGALNVEGKTICVLPCGCAFPYLLQNLDLRNRIANDGLIVSEYPLFYPVQKFSFPLRSRIISGLSRAVIIIEAGNKSGSLLTANSAADQGRDVFVVPVKKESFLSKGIYSLISDGAKVVTSAEDIINSVFKYKSYRTNKKNGKTNQTPTLTEECKKVLNKLKNRTTHIDDVTKLTGLPMNKLSSILVKLELLNLIEALPGKFYRLR